MDLQILGPGTHHARFDDHPFGNELLGNCVGRDADLRKPLSIELDVHRFRKRSKELDLRDVFDENELLSEHLHHVIELSITVFVSVERQEHAVDIGVVVDHQRRPGSGRQVPLRVADLAPKLVPNLRQRLTGDRRTHLHRDGRLAWNVPRLDALDLAEFLNRELELVADLFLDLVRRRARVRGDDQRFLNGELWVL